MTFAELYEYPVLHHLYGRSRVKQTASRITQLGKLGNGSTKVEPEDAAFFLYVLSASSATRFVFDTVMNEHELVNSKGIRFVTDLAKLLSASADLSKVKKVAIGNYASVIEYNNRHRELYAHPEIYELGSFDQFDIQFLKDLADSITATEAATQ